MVRIEKVLQGGIGACAEPYIKTAENPKVCVCVCSTLQMCSICCLAVRPFRIMVASEEIVNGLLV